MYSQLNGEPRSYLEFPNHLIGTYRYSLIKHRGTRISPCCWGWEVLVAKASKGFSLLGTLVGPMSNWHWSSVQKSCSLMICLGVILPFIQWGPPARRWAGQSTSTMEWCCSFSALLKWENTTKWRLVELAKRLLLKHWVPMDPQKWSCPTFKHPFT